MKIEDRNYKFKSLNIKEFIPQKVWKTNVVKPNEYIEEEKEDELKLPDVPSGTPELDKAEFGNLDTKPNPFEDIESRLTKLKFFNQTWLKNENVLKDHLVKPDQNQNVPEVSSTSQDNALVENEKEVPADDSIKEEVPGEQGAEAVEIEPVFSSKEDIKAFNDWYYSKIAKNKIPKKSKPISRSLETEVVKSSDSQPVVTKTSPTWKVDMNMVIVLMIALLIFLQGILKTKLPPVRAAASPTVSPHSYPVCGTCLCAVSGINRDLSGTAVDKHGDSVGKLKFPIWLSAVWLRIKRILSSPR